MENHMACVKNEKKNLFLSSYKMVSDSKYQHIWKRRKKSGGLVFSNLKNFERDWNGLMLA